jgi:hypothetical protein
VHSRVAHPIAILTRWAFVAHLKNAVKTRLGKKSFRVSYVVHPSIRDTMTTAGRRSPRPWFSYQT